MPTNQQPRKGRERRRRRRKRKINNLELQASPLLLVDLPIFTPSGTLRLASTKQLGTEIKWGLDVRCSRCDGGGLLCGPSFSHRDWCVLRSMQKWTNVLESPASSRPDYHHLIELVLQSKKLVQSTCVVSPRTLCTRIRNYQATLAGPILWLF